MLIGSNNSLTYLKSPSLWFRIKNWFVRRQEITYAEQYEYWGVRFFDLQLCVSKNDHITVKNYPHEYSFFSIYQMFNFFEKKGDVMAKITLDMSSEDYMKPDCQRVENKFCEVCHIVDTIYNNVILCGGTRKFDGKQMYEFKERDSNYKFMEVISPEEHSPLYRFVSKWAVFLVGRFNRRYIKRFKNKHVFLMLNYVNRR